MKPVAEQDSLSKNKNFVNKSDGNVEEELEPFIISIMEDNESIMERNPEDVLLYTEATLNYRLVNEKELPSESATLTITAELSVTQNLDGYLVVEPQEILSFNEDLYNAIYDSASSYTFENPTLKKIVSVVDLDWGGLLVGQNPVTVNIVISNYVSNTPSCQFTDSWYPAANFGGCNGNTATEGDAVQEINKRANNKSCNQFILHSYPYPYNIVLWYGIQKSNSFYSTNSKYSTNSIYFGSSLNCLSPSRLNELTDSCIWISNKEKPLSPDIYLRNVVVDFDPVTSIPVVYSHFYTYYYGKVMTSALMAIDPEFL